MDFRKGINFSPENFHDAPTPGINDWAAGDDDDDETVRKRRRMIVRNVCSRCDEIFKTQNELAIHSVIHLRIDKRIDCSKCSNHFTRPEDYYRHSCLLQRCSKKPQVIHRCGICPQEFPSKKTLISHQFTHPELKKVLCGQCGQIFQNHNEKSAHIRAHRQNWKQSSRDSTRTICEICGKSPKNLKQHMQLCHSEPSVMCEECGKMCNSQTQLETHKLTHLPEKPGMCPFCCFSSHNVASKRQHLAWKHLGPDGFIEFQVDSAEKPFICPECNKEYTTEVALDEHRIFHGDRTFKCRKCPWKCFTNYHLTAHNLIFHFNNPFNIFKHVPSTCEFCNEFSGNRWELYVHEITCHKRNTPGHDIDPNFMKKTDQGWHCEQCNKFYKRKHDLKYHYRAVHSGTYLYICEICGKGTNNTANMKAHMMRNHGAGVEGWDCGDRFEETKELGQYDAEMDVLISDGNSEEKLISQRKGKKDCKLLQALVGLDGEEGYKVAVTQK